MDLADNAAIPRTNSARAGMTDFVILGPESHAVNFFSIKSRDYFPLITILVRRSPRLGVTHTNAS